MKETSYTLLLTRENSTHIAAVSKVNSTLEALKSHTYKLHPKELNLFQSYKHDTKKLSFLLGKVSAKQAICSLTNLDKPETILIDSGVFEFPIVRCPTIQNIQVSVSHCNDIGISIAFPEEHPMGIDFEEINKGHAEALKDQLTPKELQLIGNFFEDDTLGYTLLWTAKEALSKIFKTGLMLDFKVLEIDKIILKDDNTWESTFKNCGQYKAISYRTDKYVYSLVLPKYSSLEVSELLRVLKSNS